MELSAAQVIGIARRRAGLSQRELAARSETSAAAICLYERGERIPRVDTLRRIIEATGATLDLLVRPAPAVDVTANAAALEELLELVDHLPQRQVKVLRAPVFAAHVRAERSGR